MPIINDPVTGELIDSETGQLAYEPGTATPPYVDSLSQSFGMELGPAGPGMGPQPVPPSALDQPDMYQPQVQPPVQQVAPQGPVNVLAPGNKVSVSERTQGFDPNVYNQQAPIRKGRAGEEQAATQEVQGLLSGQGERTQDAFQSGADAVSNEADIASRQLDAQRTMLESRGRLEARMMAAEQAANEISKAEVMAARGRWEQQVASVRAMQVDPTLNFTKPEMVGMAAALFAQGFLGAQGINVDVQGTLERWTDRYVDNQMEKIRRGERLLDSDRAVWDMVRMEAADDQDARARLRAMTLAQAGTQMEAESARWGSQLALAHGQTAVAEVKKLYAKEMANLESGWYDRLLQQKQFIQQKHYQDVSNAIAAKNAATAAATLQYQKDKDAAAAQPEADYIYSMDKDGQAVARLIPGLDDTSKRNVRTAWGKSRRVIDVSTRLQELYKEHGGNFSDAGAAKRFLDQHGQEINVLRSELVGALRDGYGTGANTTEQEVKLLIEPNTPMDTWLNVLGNAGAINVLSTVKQNAGRRFNTENGAFLQNLDGSGKAWTGTVIPGTDAEARSTQFGQAPKTSQVEAAAGELKSARQGEISANDWTEFLGLSPTGSAAAQKEFAARTGNTNKEAGAGTGFTSARGATAPSWAQDLAEVTRALVSEPDPWSDPSGQEAAQTEKTKAWDTLREMAQDTKRPERAQAAQRILTIWQAPGGQDALRSQVNGIQIKNYGATGDNPSLVTGVDSEGVGTGFQR